MAFLRVKTPLFASFGALVILLRAISLLRQGKLSVQISFDGDHKVLQSHDVCLKARTSTASVTLHSRESRCGYVNFFTRSGGDNSQQLLTLGTLSPALPRDAKKNLLQLAHNLQGQTEPADEWIIAMSDLNSKGENATSVCDALLQSLTQIYTKSPVKLVCIGERLTAGQARMIAVKSSTADVLAFIDSDDTQYPVRNEVVKNIFTCRGSGKLKLVIHGFSRTNTRGGHMYELKHNITNPFASYGIPPGLECAEKETDLEVISGAQLYDTTVATRKKHLWIHGKMHHGHPIIHRTLFQEVHYSTLCVGQDSLFLRDAISELGRDDDAAVFINRPLTFYLKNGKANKDLR